MKTQAIQPDSTSHTLLAGTILFANMDFSSLGGYALKAAIGGFIWMVFKLAGDYVSYRLTQKRHSTNENTNGKAQEKGTKKNTNETDYPNED